MWGGREVVWSGRGAGVAHPVDGLAQRVPKGERQLEAEIAQLVAVERVPQVVPRPADRVVVHLVPAQHAHSVMHTRHSEERGQRCSGECVRARRVSRGRVLERHAQLLGDELRELEVVKLDLALMSPHTRERGRHEHTHKHIEKKNSHTYCIGRFQQQHKSLGELKNFHSKEKRDATQKKRFTFISEQES